MESPLSDSSASSHKLLGAVLVVSAVAGLVVLLNSGGEDPNEGADPNETVSLDSGQIAQKPAANAVEWQSERIADAADQQLRKLAGILNSPGRPDAVALESLVTASVSGMPLRPQQFEDRFHSSTLTIRRGLNFEAATRYRGVNKLAECLAQLSEPFSAATQIHSKFKIISVELEVHEGAEPDSVTTDVVFQRVGTFEDGSFQQDATWQCVWKLSAGGQAAPETAMDLRIDQLTLLRYEEARQQSADRHLFSDCTESVFSGEVSFPQQILPGIDYWRSLIQKQYGVFPFGHHGIAVGDVNGDGLDDLYVGQPAGLPNRLYLQNVDGTVSDAAAESGVDLLDRTRGVLLIDVDEDGDQDLVAVLEKLIVFLANDGQAHFTEMVAVPTSEPGALSAADYDLDGDLDIYVVNYHDRTLNAPDVYHDANNGGANSLLRNDGGWKFTDVTRESGLDQNNRRWSFAASWEDYDNDGDPDLYVANDFGRNNLYRNEGGRFTDIASKAGVEDVAAGMSASWADFDHDGRMDLYVGNMFSSAGLRITGQSQFQQRAPLTVRKEFRRHARGNSLFRNLGGERFEDVSEAAGVTIGRWAWASRFIDINNDGWEDIVVANGFVTGHQTKDL